MGHWDSPPEPSQLIGAIPAGQEALVDVLMRIEQTFRLLEVQIDVRPTSVMVETMLEIMIAVLSILAMVTQQIKHGRTSESWRYISFLSTYDCLEKYLKKLVGGAGIEDALSRLEGLSRTLTRTAGAERLKLICTMDSDVLALNEMPGVNDKEREHVQQTSTAQGIVGNVKSVDDRAPSISDGAQFVFR